MALKTKQNKEQEGKKKNKKKKRTRKGKTTLPQSFAFSLLLFYLKKLEKKGYMKEKEKKSWQGDWIIIFFFCHTINILETIVLKMLVIETSIVEIQIWKVSDTIFK